MATTNNIIHGGGIINVSYVDTDPIQNRGPMGTLPPAQSPLVEDMNFLDMPKPLKGRLMNALQPTIKDPTVIAPEPYREALQSVNKLVNTSDFWENLPLKTEQDPLLAEALQALFQNEIENQNLVLMYRNLLYSA
ncbi:MAG TPA: hypothetical protein PLV25_02575 [Opitutales bacterium]|nr:hypothetical protein [Opitutales bacterium]